MKLRTQILLFFLLIALLPLIVAVGLNLPLVLERMELFYHKAHLQNLRADFRDLDQHLASREEMVKLLSRLPEPGSMLGHSSQDEQTIDQARTRYTSWINQILRDQLDIIQIIFLDSNGNERFWLERDINSQQWQPTLTPPAPLNREFINSVLQVSPGNILASPISLAPEAGAEDPRRIMTLRLAGTIGDAEQQIIGAVMLNIDVGGIARYYRNTLWVHANGTFLQYTGSEIPGGNAFAQFDGLAAIFASEKPALWKGDGGQIMWVPMFLTEQSGALWVGRSVDPSPISQFRNALTLRVLTMVLLLSIAVWFAARWAASRADRIGRELIDGVQQVLNDEGEVKFDWESPQELKKLGQNLSRLSTEHVRNIRDLRLHAEKLEESNRYKSQFLANVSHELRTPLNSILLLSKLLAESRAGLSAEQVQQARVINEAGSDLQALIDNILDLSRIEARRATINREQTDLPELLQSLVELVEPQFQAKPLPLSLEIAADAPRRIDTDPDKLRQILKNFLANALKFTEQGSVRLRLDVSDRPDYDLCLSVSDTGIGIPESQQQHIFEAFKQADGATNRRYGGTGLGLSISQQLAHLLEGEIELRSSAGQGATFSLHLPLRMSPQRDESGTQSEPSDTPATTPPNPTPAPPPPVEIPASLSGCRVLLVDDEIDDLLELTQLLESWGIEVTAAGDSSEALEVLQEEEPFDLVLIDMLMPQSESYDTIETIRGQQRLRDLAIIALTSGDTPDNFQAPAEIGADELLSKPVNEHLLLETISRHLPR
ncbi:MAG: response regulator [Gammaproteobacteria bacterium]|nr:response regulator [Gammaproteobacteria bacterium]